ncbi:MAG: hypothetical protein OXL97_00170 [Chloroflexota bacterium]|nr:hypothetical protein [Chloroflexota bacterium]MDE2885470.1 hypothetical protein [Chloroflexota bacterium]
MAANEHILYEPDERSPLSASLAVGFQGAVFLVIATTLLVSITLGGDSHGEEYLTWAVFAALIINGAATALQAGRFWRFGAGHVFFTCTMAGYLPVTRLALAQGGPALMASLVVVSSLLQFMLSAWLPLLRRIVTPVVSGTVLLLVAVMTIPIAFDQVADVPEDAPAGAELLIIGAVLAVIVPLGLLAGARLRLWSPILGIGAGCAVAAVLGMYDIRGAIDAPWVGVPTGGWPGMDLTPGAEFWAVLPLFLVVSLVHALKVVGGGIAMQRVSWRAERVTDFRRVQGAVNGVGASTLLSGIAGTPPPAVQEANSVTFVSLTGVASRHVGYAVGAMMVGLAFLPKVAAFLLAVPSPVMGIYLMTIMGMLFVEGARTVLQDGLDYRKTIVVAISFALGVGFQSQDLFSEVAGEVWGALLGNGLAAGTLAAIVMTGVLNLTSPRSQRLETELDISALGRIDGFLQQVAGQAGWSEASADRLRFVGEEVLSSLLQKEEEEENGAARRLAVIARPSARTVELEFLSSLADENLEDRLSYMGEQTEVPQEHEISYRLLRHYASSVRHRKYHGLDIVTVHVEGSR